MESTVETKWRFVNLWAPFSRIEWKVLISCVNAKHLIHNVALAVQGWGLLSQFPPFRYFPNFSSLSKHTFTVTYRVYIWQVSPQLSCGDTCQILMWFDESNMYFCKIENFAYGEIDERSFSNPHPWGGVNKAPFVNFSVMQILDIAEVIVRFFKSHSSIDK